MILALLVIGAGGVLAWWFVTHAGLESTDDAQLDADIAPVSARSGGVVVAVHFEDNQRVHRGDLLAELDADSARAALARAQAALDAAEAQAAAAEAAARVAETDAAASRAAAEAGLETATNATRAHKQQVREALAAVRTAEAARDRAKTDLTRDKDLYAAKALPKAQLDRSQSAYDIAASQLAAARARVGSLRASVTTSASQIGEAKARVDQTSNVDTRVELARANAKAARAQVAVARANRDIAALHVQDLRVVALHDGVISGSNVSVGQTVGPGQPFARIVTDGVWVEANYQETQLTTMRPGQPVEVEVDAFPDLVLRGHVDSFSAATGARFALLPPDNATGNFTKVVQRVPVRIALDDAPSDVPLRPGMSVVCTVDTRPKGAH